MRFPRLKTLIDWFNDTAFRKLFKNAGLLFSGSMVASLLGFGCLLFTVRALGPEKLGVLVLIQTYASVVSTLVSLRSWPALIKYGAEELEGQRPDSFKGIVKIGVLFDASSALLGTAVAVCAAYWVGSWKGWPIDTINMIILYSLSILFNVSATSIAVLRLFDRFHLLAIPESASFFIRLLLVVAAYFFHAELWVFVLIWLVTDVVKNLILATFGLLTLIREGYSGWWKGKYKEWRKILRFSLWDNLTAIADLPLMQLDNMIVAAVISVEAVGVYKVFKQSGQILTRISGPIYEAIFPQFSVYIARGNPRSAILMASKSGSLLMLFSLPLAVLASLLSPWWMNLLFGAAYAKYPLALGIYLVTMSLTVSFSSIHPLFIALGLVEYNLLILVLANCVYLSLAYYLGSLYGMLGVISALTVQFSSVAMSKIWIISAKTKSTDWTGSSKAALEQ